MTWHEVFRATTGICALRQYFFYSKKVYEELKIFCHCWCLAVVATMGAFILERPITIVCNHSSTGIVELLHHLCPWDSVSCFLLMHIAQGSQDLLHKDPNKQSALVSISVLGTRILAKLIRWRERGQGTFRKHGREDMSFLVRRGTFSYLLEEEFGDRW